MDVSEEIFSRADFIELGNLMCSRLTLFNRRCGGELARVKVRKWLERWKWLAKVDIERLNEEEKLLNKSMDLSYLNGKGSCIIPNDSIPAVHRLCLDATRVQAGISHTKKFVFPSSREWSEKHVAGWFTTTVCQQAGLENKNITATSQRQRSSTLYAAVHCGSEDGQHLYAHFGHEREVNEGTYERPLPILAKNVVGSFRRDVDSFSELHKKKIWLINLSSKKVSCFSMMRLKSLTKLKFGLW